MSCEGIHAFSSLHFLTRISPQKIRGYIESTKQDEVESLARLDN